MSKKYTIELTEEEVQTVITSLNYVADRYGDLAFQMIKDGNYSDYTKFREEKMNARLLCERVKKVLEK